MCGDAFSIASSARLAQTSDCIDGISSMKLSPMLKHALESLEHGLEHYLDGTERSRKFALLHIDHAIELMVKEKCVMLGKSIFKGDGTSLSLHEAFHSIKKEGVAMPEQPRLEDLHDLRNTIQHKGLVPDVLTAQFHIETAYGFAKRFLGAELDVPLSDVLPARYRVLMEGAMSPTAAETAALPQVEGQSGLNERLAELAIALRDAWLAANLTSQIIAAYSVLQQAVRILAGQESATEKIKFRQTLRDAAVRRGATPSRFDKKLQGVLITRGQATKPDNQLQDKHALGMLRAVEKILEMVGFDSVVDAAAQMRVAGDAHKTARA